MNLNVNLILVCTDIQTLFSQQYSLDIRDNNQVLLISNVKKMGPTQGPPPGPAMLIPELCFLTGYHLILQCATASAKAMVSNVFIHEEIITETGHLLHNLSVLTGLITFLITRIQQKK